MGGIPGSVGRAPDGWREGGRGREGGEGGREGGSNVIRNDRGQYHKIRVPFLRELPVIKRGLLR